MFALNMGDSASWIWLGDEVSQNSVCDANFDLLPVNSILLIFLAMVDIFLTS